MDNKHIFATNLKRLMQLKGVSRQDISNALSVSYFTVSDWVNGKKYPRMDKVEQLANYFGVLKSVLIENEKAPESPFTLPSNIRPVTLKRFPLLGEIACGTPIFASEDHETYIDASADIKADFCLVAKGDSMTGARINNGDVVFIREQPTVENGEIAAVIIGDEATLKRWYFYPEKQKLMLTPENPAFEPLVYIGPELNEVRCLGKAVSFMSKL